MPERKTDQQPSGLERQFGELKWTPRAKEALGSVFLQEGRYPSSTQALLEFTDNSVGYRNRDRDYPTHVGVVIDKDRIVVTDYGSIGTDAEGIKQFAQIGETQEMGIGYRGGGAKFAAWYFGEDLEISAKRSDDRIEYATRINGFGNTSIDYTGMFAIDPTVSTWLLEKGRFEITIRKLKHPENLPQGAALRKAMSEVYRPLLARQVFDFKYPTKLEKRKIVDEKGLICEVDDKITLKVTTSRKTEQVLPLAIPLLPGYSEEDLKVVKTTEGERLGYWAGEMDTLDSRSKLVEPGMRFYYDGRLITIDYCGFDKRDPHLSGLVGEVHLDHIKGIKEQLPVNKSAGINTQSEQWKRVIESVHRAINPLVEELQKKPILIVEQKPAFLERAFSEAKKLADLCLRDMANEGVYFTVEDLASMLAETYGQKPIIRRREGNKPKEEKRDGKPWGEQKGRTIPGPEADPEIHRIRKSFCDRIEYINLPDAATVSVLRDIEEVSRKCRVLQINQNSPLVQLAILEGELSTTRLVFEEIGEWAAREHSSDLDTFLKIWKESRYRIGRMLSDTAAYRRLAASRTNV